MIKADKLPVILSNFKYSCPSAAPVAFLPSGEAGEIFWQQGKLSLQILANLLLDLPVHPKAEGRAPIMILRDFIIKTETF